jgi:hypothetical protein
LARKRSFFQVIPPGLVLTPTRRPPTAARLAFQPKSLSTGQLLDKEDQGYNNNNAADNQDNNLLKSWWNKFSNRWFSLYCFFPIISIPCRCRMRRCSLGECDVGRKLLSNVHFSILLLVFGIIIFMFCLDKSVL